MIKDEERREVARRLREIRPCKGGHIKWWEIARALGLKQPAGWFGWEKFEPDSANRLADLIDPGEPKVRCVAEVKVDGERLEQLVHDAVAEVTGIDRDALLKLADEIDSFGDDIYRTIHRVAAFVDSWESCARRMREALGSIDKRDIRDIQGVERVQGTDKPGIQRASHRSNRERVHNRPRHAANAGGGDGHGQKDTGGAAEGAGGGTMSMANNPYFIPRTRCTPEKDARSVQYADGTQPHRGDRVLDGRGRALTVIGINSKTGRVMAVDADRHMVEVDPLELEVVERDA